MTRTKTLQPIIIIMLLVFSGWNAVKAQDTVIEINNGFFFQDTIEPTYYTDTCSFPSELFVYGKVIDASVAVSCGPHPMSTTLQFQILSKTIPFSDSVVIIVVNCLANGDDIIGNYFELQIEGLLADDRRICHPILNKFHSETTPFYFLPDSERKKLLNVTSD